MSSILDAVTKDSARSGGVPGGANVPSPGDGGGPSRYRAAALVVVFGVAAGALAARMFGGSAELPADDMLTEKVERRAVAKAEGGGEPAQPVAGRDGEEPARASRKDENAHQRYLAKKKEAAAAAAAKTAAGANDAPPPGPAAAPPPVVVAVAPAEPPATAVVVGAVPAPGAPPVVVTAPPPQPAIVAGTPVPPAAPNAAAPGVAAPAILAGEASPPLVVTPPAGAPVVSAPGAPVVVTTPPAVVETPPIETPPVVASADSPPVTLESGEEAASADAAAAPADVVSAERPSGAPEVSILFVAWSREPAERVASVRVAAGSLSVVHEGEYVEGLQISAIHPEAVDLAWTGQKFRVAVNPF